MRQVTGAYLEVIEKILNEFADVVIQKGAVLGLSSDVELNSVVAEARQELFALAHGVLLTEEFRGVPEYERRAIGILEERHPLIIEHLQRKVALRELDTITPSTRKEREQKFGILLSPMQAARDFEAWAREAGTQGNPIAILFVDLDHFRVLNERYTHTKVDQTILPAVQKLLAQLVQFRGEAYRHGGEEFLLIVPNQDFEEARAFAEKVRKASFDSAFEVDGAREIVTVSIGVALWPVHGGSYEAVLEAANKAEVEAKETRNTVRMATSAAETLP